MFEKHCCERQKGREELWIQTLGAPEPGTRSYRGLWRIKHRPGRDSAHTWFHLGSGAGRQTRSGQENTTLSVQIPERWRTGVQTCVWFHLLLL